MKWTQPVPLRWPHKSVYAAFGPVSFFAWMELLYELDASPFSFDNGAIIRSVVLATFPAILVSAAVLLYPSPITVLGAALSGLALALSCGYLLNRYVHPGLEILDVTVPMVVSLVVVLQSMALLKKAHQLDRSA